MKASSSCPLKTFHEECRDIYTTQKFQSKELQANRKSLKTKAQSTQEKRCLTSLRSGYCLKMSTTNVNSVVQLPFIRPDGFNVKDQLVSILGSHKNDVISFTNSLYSNFSELPKIFAQIQSSDLTQSAPFLPAKIKQRDFLACSALPSLFGHCWSIELRHSYIDFLMEIVKQLPQSVFNTFHEHWLFECFKNYIHASNIHHFLQLSMGDTILELVRLDPERGSIRIKPCAITIIKKMKGNISTFPKDVRLLLKKFSDLAPTNEERMNRIEILFFDCIVVPAISLPKAYSILPPTYQLDNTSINAIQTLNALARGFRASLHLDESRLQGTLTESEIEDIRKQDFPKFLKEIVDVDEETIDNDGLRVTQLMSLLQTDSLSLMFTMSDICLLSKILVSDDLLPSRKRIPLDKEFDFEYFRIEFQKCEVFGFERPTIITNEVEKAKSPDVFSDASEALFKLLTTVNSHEVEEERIINTSLNICDKTINEVINSSLGEFLKSYNNLLNSGFENQLYIKERFLTRKAQNQKKIEEKTDRPNINSKPDENQMNQEEVEPDPNSITINYNAEIKQHENSTELPTEISQSSTPPHSIETQNLEESSIETNETQYLEESSIETNETQNLEETSIETNETQNLEESSIETNETQNLEETAQSSIENEGHGLPETEDPTEKPQSLAENEPEDLTVQSSIQTETPLSSIDSNENSLQPDSALNSYENSNENAISSDETDMLHEKSNDVTIVKSYLSDSNMRYISYYFKLAHINKNYPLSLFLTNLAAKFMPIKRDEFGKVLESLEGDIRRSLDYIKRNDDILTQIARNIEQIETEDSFYNEKAEHVYPIIHSSLLQLFLDNEKGLEQVVKEKAFEMMSRKSAFHEFYTATIIKLKNFIVPIAEYTLVGVASSFHTWLMQIMTLDQFIAANEIEETISQQLDATYIDRVCVKPAPAKLSPIFAIKGAAQKLFVFVTMELREAELVEIPLEAVNYISSALNLIERMFDLAIGGAPQADEMTPLFNYSLLSSGMNRMVSLEKYLEHFLYELPQTEVTLLNEHTKIALTHFIHHISSLVELISTE